MLQLVRDKAYKINNFTILGERHSGTNFLEKLIKQNFSLEITWHCGWKHFFGFNAPSMIRSKNTLFIATIRNPYDWIMAMRKKPHHVHPDNLSSIESMMFNEWHSMQSVYREILEDRHIFTGQRYKNIFELRKVKTEYLYYKAPILCDNYIFIKYEDLLNSYSSILDIIETKFNLIRNTHSKVKVIEKTPYKIEPDIKQMIDNNIDWSIENLLGYFQK